MLLLYFLYCDLNPRFAALVSLGNEKCIPIFLPSVHFWNKNFLCKWEREESWVLVLALKAAAFKHPNAGWSWPLVGAGLTPSASRQAAIKLGATLLLLSSTETVKSETNTPLFSLCRISFQPLYLFLSCVALKCPRWALWGHQIIRAMFHIQASPAVNCKTRDQGAQAKYSYLMFSDKENWYFWDSPKH